MIRFFLAFLIFLSSPAFLSAVGYIQQPSGTISADTPSTLIASLIAYAIGIAAILGVIGVTWGGIQMILSAGDDEKHKKGKNTIIYSLIGVGLAGLAYGIVTIISSLKI